ncbi:peptide chain release factor N(5)-glutamine methyltransferase [Lachnospira multipara]|uniref:peptide chain release factor N(5)-glutamine methyltransferase n=1 Tax=Lachnospira multipara TaxID=28051 RepID=UPI0004E1D6FD|nr:peptide chain release factor N(5)-glutamine methyltransferase [Lachnospira multipara]
MTIKEKLLEATSILEKQGIDNASYDAKELLMHVLNISNTDLLLNSNKIIEDFAATQYDECIKRRANHEPLQHITGIAYFYGREFLVNEHVLIPRYDTENLCYKLLDLIEENDRILDMCTGSGCIIETLFLESKCSKKAGDTVAVDISKEALEVAKNNAARLGIDAIEFINSDLFEELNDDFVKFFDVIVSNPPYIRTSVIEELDKEVKLHDPFIALDGKEDGLLFYRKITRDCRPFLKEGGYLAYEIGHDQAADVSKIMKDNGFSDIKVYKDLSGFDRVVIGKYIH